MIRQISVDGLIECPEFPALLQEYADECPPKSGMPHTYNKATYKALEESGALQSFGAFGEDEELLGFVTVIITMLPKYTSLIGATESFFVASKHRKTGAGVKLLRAAEAKASEAGAFGMLVSAPSGGRLAEVMPKSGYEESDIIFFKGLK
jgi:GNAT superfamily N-acetyltransferase|tara:strand:- start:567 stop:1016 length:450 start_codon:yes stop_codon:yes gene_type:complete